MTLALRRLQGHGLRTRFILTNVVLTGLADLAPRSARIAAALAFPLSRGSFTRLRAVLLPRDHHELSDPAPTDPAVSDATPEPTP